jgi:hypothetical protein
VARSIDEVRRLLIFYPDISISEVEVRLARKHLHPLSRFLIAHIKHEFEKALKVLLELDLIDVDALRRIRTRPRRPRMKSPPLDTWDFDGGRYGRG